ncbi:hypothetical protein CHUAL_005500 [Chamberlinius hualienensis]
MNLANQETSLESAFLTLSTRIKTLFQKISNLKFICLGKHKSHHHLSLNKCIFHIFVNLGKVVASSPSLETNRGGKQPELHHLKYTFLIQYKWQNQDSQAVNLLYMNFIL